MKSKGYSTIIPDIHPFSPPFSQALERFKHHLDADGINYEVLPSDGIDDTDIESVVIRVFHTDDSFHIVYLTEDDATFFWESSETWEDATPISSVLDCAVSRSQLGASLSQVMVDSIEEDSLLRLHVYHIVNLYGLGQSAGNQLGFENLAFHADVNAVKKHLTEFLALA